MANNIICLTTTLTGIRTELVGGWKSLAHDPDTITAINGHTSGVLFLRVAWNTCFGITMGRICAFRRNKA